MGEAATLSKAELFHGLKPADLKVIEAITDTTTYAKGDLLFEEGSRGDKLYIIKTGKVRIDLKLKSDSDCATVHRLRAGQILGELALIDKRKRSASATCETKSQILSIHCDRLLKVLEGNPTLGYAVVLNLARIVATRLRKTNLQLVATVCWHE